MTKPLTWTSIVVLLVAPWVASLWTASYNRATPAVGGFPFFYWYQLMWIPISVVTTGLAYVLIRRLERDRRTTTPPGAVADAPAEPTATNGE